LRRHTDGIHPYGPRGWMGHDHLARGDLLVRIEVVVELDVQPQRVDFDIGDDGCGRIAVQYPERHRGSLGGVYRYLARVAGLERIEASIEIRVGIRPDAISASGKAID